MFAALSFALFMASDGVAAAKDADTRPHQLARQLAWELVQARQDFEVRYAELGLIGAAPLAGKEPAKPASDEILSHRTEFDGAAQAPAAPQSPARNGAH